MVRPAMEGLPGTGDVSYASGQMQAIAQAFGSAAFLTFGVRLTPRRRLLLTANPESDRCGVAQGARNTCNGERSRSRRCRAAGRQRERARFGGRVRAERRGNAATQAGLSASY